MCRGTQVTQGVPTPGPAGGQGFAQTVREATRSAHGAAEGSPLFDRLTAGTLPLGVYVAFVVQLEAVYAALEAPAEQMRTDPVVGPFVVPALHRTAALQRDLAHLLPLVDARPALSAATTAYVERLGEVADVPHRWLAHHYTRYLGDLSGGQSLRAAAERAYGLGQGRGTDLYRFPGLGGGAAFTRAYRVRLDAAAWDGGQREELVAEVLTAYRLSTALVQEPASPPVR